MLWALTPTPQGAAPRLAPWLQLLPWEPWTMLHHSLRKQCLGEPRGLGRRLLRVFLGCGLGVGTMPGRGDTGGLPWPHHLLAICLRQSPPALLLPVPMMERDWASWLACCCQVGAGLWGTACSGLSQSPKPQVPSPATRRHGMLSASLPAPSHLKSQRFIGGRRTQVGLVLKLSSMGALWGSPRGNGNGNPPSHSGFLSTFSIPGLMLSVLYSRYSYGCSPQPYEVGTIVITLISTDQEG